MTTITNEFNAPNSTFNTVSGDQHITYITNVDTSGSTAVASSSRVAPPPSTPGFNDAPVDLLSTYFTGRQTELARIAHAFGRPRGQVPLRCVLFGDQGVGKSQLTYEWSKSTFARGENTYVVWISATTVEKLDQGFSKILHLIEHPQQFHPEQTVRLTAARRWLEEVDSGNWLLVLDNVVPEVLGFLRDHLPRKNGRGSILFTTRTKDVAIALASAAGDQHEIVRVPMLSVLDGVELFLGQFHGAEIDIPPAKAQGIVKSVGCLPLAISHAAAYMKRSASTIDEMLALYEGKNKFHAINWKNTLSEYEHQSVAATFENQLQDLERNCPNATNLLNVLAYFDPESIPLDMLVDGATSALKSRNPKSAPSLAPAPRKAQSIVQKIKNKVLRGGDNKGKGRAEEDDTIPVVPPKVDSLFAVVQSPIELRKAVMELQTRCLTSHHDSTHSTLRIHDLIQLVVLEKMRNIATEQRQWFECAVELVCDAFGRIEDQGSPACWHQCEILIPHIQSLTIRQDISSKAKARLLVTNSMHGWYLRNRGRYGEAEQLLVGVLADQEQLWGLEDERTLGTMYHLGVVYNDLGRHVDAETLLKRVLKTRGQDHVKTLGTMYELASVYYSQRRFAESEELAEKVLKAREKQLGPDHIDTLRTKNMLAETYRHQKPYREAETLFKEVLNSMERQFGPDHVKSAATMNNLALLYFDQGHYSDAEKLFERVLRVMEKQLGSNHPNTLLAKHNLAEVYESQGRYSDAEKLFVQVLADREEVLGPSHPRTRLTAQHLAFVYEKLGCFDDAARVPFCMDEVLVPHIKSLTVQQLISNEAKTELLIADSLYGWYLRVLQANLDLGARGEEIMDGDVVSFLLLEKERRARENSTMNRADVLGTPVSYHKRRRLKPAVVSRTYFLRYLALSQAMVHRFPQHQCLSLS